MAAYLLTFPIDDEAGLISYLGELLGSGSETTQLAKELVQRRKSETDTSVRVGKAKKKGSNKTFAVSGPAGGAKAGSGLGGGGPVPAATANGSVVPPVTADERRLTQKERARLNRLDGGARKGAAAPPPVGGIKVSYNAKPVPTADSDAAAAEGAGLSFELDEDGFQIIPEVLQAEEAVPITVRLNLCI